MKQRIWRFFDEDDTGGSAPPIAVPPVETPQVVQPVIDHAEKIGRLDEKLGQQERNLLEQIGQVRSDLFQAIEEGGRGTTERIAALEDKLATLLAKEERVEEAAPLPTPEQAEVQVAPPEKQYRYVVRNGRRVKREVR